MTSKVGAVALGAVVAATVLAIEAGRGSPAQALGSVAAARGYAQLPLAFEENRGQYARGVRYVAHGAGATLAVRDRDVSVAFASGAGLRLRFAARSAHPVATAHDRLPGRANYLLGNDERRWLRDVSTFRRVDLHGIASGIDLSLYGNGKRLEYDVVVRPGTDPRRFAMAVDGAASLDLAANGDLLIRRGRDVLRQHRPLAYQRIDGRLHRVESAYALRGPTSFGFELGAYDRSKTLVVDPVFPFYATYLGGAAREMAMDVAVDGAGNAYVAGWTDSTDFPTVNAPDGSLVRDPSFCESVDPCADAFVTKLNTAGTAVVYSTYLGGKWDDRIRSIVVDTAGNAYVTGKTTSTDFPTANAYDSTRANGAIGDGFVAKLSPDGASLRYSTYLGGFGVDDPLGIAIEGDGAATVAGNTLATDYPTTPGALARTCAIDYGSGYCYRNFFVTKLAPAGNALLSSTYVPVGDGPTFANAVAFDNAGGVYFTGATASDEFPVTPGAFQTTRPITAAYDAFVLKTAGTSALAYATYIGADYGVDEALAIDVDASGAAYVTGRTDSQFFPVTPNALDQLCERTGQQCTNVFDAFVAKLSPGGGQLVYATYLGSDGRDQGRAIAVDPSGNVTVAGEAEAYNLPTREAYQAQPLNVNCQRSLSATCADIFLTRFAPDWSLVYSTYFGASNLNDSADVVGGLALRGGSAFVAGATTSTHLASPGAYKTSCGVSGDGVCDANAGDALVARFDFAPAGACSVVGGVLSVAVGGSPVTLRRSGDSLQVLRAGAVDSTCGTATVTGISQVDVTGTSGSDAVTLDLGGGPFSPGSRPEPDGDQEIKIDVDLAGGDDGLTILGGGAPDRILQSREWGDLTPDADHDTLLHGVEHVTIDGGAGGDQLRAWGAGAAFTLRGGPGTDDLLGHEGDDTIGARDGDVDTVQCGSGTDSVLADPSDSVAGDCEHVDRSGGGGTTRPPNDDFANAQPTGLSGGSLTASNVGATKEPGEPNHAGNAGGASVWYRWVAPGDGMAAVTTQGSPFDTLLAAYRGATLAGLTPVAANDDWQTATETRRVSTIRFRVQAGAEYAIAVDGHDGATGTFALAFTFTHPGQPNDLWADAQPLSGASGWVDGDTTASTVEFGESYKHNGSSVWYRWVAPETGVAAFATMTVTTQGTTGALVYTGPTLDLLAEVPLADRSPEGQFNVTAGTTYWIAVTSMGGPFTLTWRSGHPRNDAFAGAEWLGYPYTDIGVANGGATLEPGEPRHAGVDGGASLWFRWTAPSTGRAEFYTRVTGVDTILAVYTGTTLSTLTPIAANDDRGAGDASSYVSFDAVAGRVYRIAVDVKGGAWTTFRLAWFTNVTAIANETVLGAEPLLGSSGTRSGGSATGKEADEPDHAGSSGGRSIWFRWTAPSSGTVAFDTSGSTFNTLLAVYRGYARHDIRTLIPVAANDDAGSGTRTSRVTFDASSGTTYWIAVDGFADGIDVAGGMFTLSWQEGAGAPADTTPPDTAITTAPPSSTTSTAATFAFTATETGAAFACSLDYAAFASCGSPISYTNLGVGAHTFRVQATDPTGNVDPTPAGQTWTIQAAPQEPDTTPPDTAITAAPPASTMSTGATFAFTATEAGSAFACSLDNAAFATCSSPISYTSLGVGTHTFRVQATDPAGNLDPSPAGHSWTIQTSPSPTAPGGGGGGGGGVPPDLHVEVTSSATVAPAVGAELDFFVTVSSKSIGGASEVRLDVDLPAGYALSSTYADRGPGCTGSPPRLTCDVAWVNGGVVSHLRIAGTVGQAGEQDLTVAARSLVEPELDSSDNTVTVKLMPTAPPAAEPATGATAGVAVTQVVAPKLTGAARPGGTLRVTPAVWPSRPASVRYRWQSCRARCTTIRGATRATFHVTRAYRGSGIRVVATALVGQKTMTAVSKTVRIGNR